MKALKLTDFPNGACKPASTLTSYETGKCYNTGNPTFPTTPLSGTYYFTGSVKLNGTPKTISGTATLIFFSTGTLNITGNQAMQLTAMKSPSGPDALSSVMHLMNGLLIYDGEVCQKDADGTCKSNSTVNISGNSESYFNGTVYVPNAPVTYGGNSSASAPTGENACYQVIAYAVNFQGNTKLDNSGCNNSGAVKPDVQTVRLVQ
jgi:hypothetical protein